MTPRMTVVLPAGVEFVGWTVTWRVYAMRGIAVILFDCIQ
jgi:hypothetical protein